MIQLQSLIDKTFTLAQWPGDRFRLAVMGRMAVAHLLDAAIRDRMLVLEVWRSGDWLGKSPGQPGEWLDFCTVREPEVELLQNAKPQSHW